MMKRLVEFFFEVGMLKKTPRTGYQFLGSGGESVADHCFRTAVIGYGLASLCSGADVSKVVFMCLFHDLPEARTGDHNYVNKRYARVDEESAIRDLLRNLAFGDKVRGLLTEFDLCRTLEARLSRDADQLDLILELKGQQDLGNRYAVDWISFAVRRLMTEEAREVAREILTTDSAQWWFDKNTDWWVNGPQNGRNGT